MSKKTPSSRSWSATSSAQRAKPRPPSGWSEAPAGIGYGLPPRSPTASSASSQLGRKPMSKPASDSRTSAPMIRESRMLPTARSPASGQSTQCSCTSTQPSPRSRRDGRDLARVVRLDAADRDERVAALRERVGGEVLELAHLVAAVGEPGVAVLALGPDLDPAAEVLAQPLEPVDRRRAERERDAREVGEPHVATDRNPRSSRVTVSTAAGCVHGLAGRARARRPGAASVRKNTAPTDAAAAAKTAPTRNATW